MDGEFIHAITKAALSGEVCHRCGHAWHSDSCVNVAPAVEPAQAVPVAHMRVMVGCRAPDDCEEYLDVCNHDDVGIDGKAFPVYRESPSIPAELREKVLKFLTHVDRGYHTIGQQHEMATLMKEIREMMGAGNGD